MRMRLPLTSFHFQEDTDKKKLAALIDKFEEKENQELLEVQKQAFDIFSDSPSKMPDVDNKKLGHAHT